MESRSLCGWIVATGPDRPMQPDKASAVTATISDNRNACITRTGPISHTNETGPVLHPLWLIKGSTRAFVADASDQKVTLKRLRQRRSGKKLQCHRAHNSRLDS